MKLKKNKKKITHTHTHTWDLYMKTSKHLREGALNQTFYQCMKEVKQNK